MEITVGIPDSATADVTAAFGSKEALEDDVAAYVAKKVEDTMRLKAAQAAADAVVPPVVVGGTIAAAVADLKNQRAQLVRDINAIPDDPDDPTAKAMEQNALREQINDLDVQIAALG